MDAANVPLPPIVLDDSGDIQVFPSVEAACREIEAIDVKEGVYEAFDTRGRRLYLSVDGDRVTADLASPIVDDSVELLNRLRRFISRVGAERVGVTEPETAALSTLLQSLLIFLWRPKYPRRSAGTD